MASHSISVWIERLRASDPLAAGALWERFFARMVRLARQRLANVPRLAADEEDVALSAFLALHRGVQQGRFPRLADRDDLWNILFTLTVRKAISLARQETRERRGGLAVRVPLPETEAAGDELSPDDEVALREEMERLLKMLDDDQLRQIAIARMEGYSNAEIADRLSCAIPTVERRLRLIRGIWEHAREEETEEK